MVFLTNLSTLTGRQTDRQTKRGSPCHALCRARARAFLSRLVFIFYPTREGARCPLAASRCLLSAARCLACIACSRVLSFDHHSLDGLGVACYALTSKPLNTLRQHCTSIPGRGDLSCRWSSSQGKERKKKGREEKKVSKKESDGERGKKKVTASKQALVPPTARLVSPSRTTPISLDLVDSFSIPHFRPNSSHQRQVRLRLQLRPPPEHTSRSVFL